MRVEFDHQKRHEQLHLSFHELMIDWIDSTGESPTGKTLKNLVNWSYDQKIAPDHQKINHKETVIFNHRERHIVLHGNLSELCSDWLTIINFKKNFNTNITELYEWSLLQMMKTDHEFEYHIFKLQNKLSIDFFI